MFLFYSAQVSELVIYRRELSIVQEDKKLRSWMIEGKGGLFEKKWKKMYAFSMSETTLSVNCLAREQGLYSRSGDLCGFCSFIDLLILVTIIITI